MLIFFIVDTNVAMGARLSGDLSFLDHAKSGVEYFIKKRTTQQRKEADRFILMTFEPGAECLKTGYRNNLSQLQAALRGLRATHTGPSDPTHALDFAFNMIASFRAQINTDTVGHGRNLTFTEPAAVVVFSAGGGPGPVTGARSELGDRPPLVASPVDFSCPSTGVGYSQGSIHSQLFDTCLRWDHRVYHICLAAEGTGPGTAGMAAGSTQRLARALRLARQAPIPAAAGSARPSPMAPPVNGGNLSRLVRSSGGRAFLAPTLRRVQQAVDELLGLAPSTQALSAKTLAGLVAELPGLVSPTGPTAASTQALAAVPIVESAGAAEPFFTRPSFRVLLEDPVRHPNLRHSAYVYLKADPSRNSAAWPIPESFLPEASHNSFPPRTAHPLLSTNSQFRSIPIIPGVTPDEYEISTCALTFPLVHYATSHKCWYVFLRGSTRRCDPEGNFLDPEGGASPASGPGGGSGADPALSRPFGYLRFDAGRLRLCIMPYNFPMLQHIVCSLSNAINSDTTATFVKDYLASVPMSLQPSIHTILKDAGFGHLLSARVDTIPGASLHHRLQRLRKHASEHLTNLDSVTPPAILDPFSSLLVATFAFSSSVINLTEARRLWAQQRGLAGPAAGPAGNLSPTATAGPAGGPPLSRKHLLQSLSLMRGTLFAPDLLDILSGARNSAPIGEMGNYQAILASTRSLRPVEEALAPGGSGQTGRRNYFGNPYRNRDVAVDDEADEGGALRRGLGPDSRGMSESRHSRRRSSVSSGGGGTAAAPPGTTAAAPASAAAPAATAATTTGMADTQLPDAVAPATPPPSSPDTGDWSDARPDTPGAGKRPHADDPDDGAGPARRRRRIGTSVDPLAAIDLSIDRGTPTTPGSPEGVAPSMSPTSVGPSAAGSPRPSGQESFSPRRPGVPGPGTLVPPAAGDSPFNWLFRPAAAGLEHLLAATPGIQMTDPGDMAVSRDFCQEQAPLLQQQLQQHLALACLPLLWTLLDGADPGNGPPGALESLGHAVEALLPEAGEGAAGALIQRLCILSRQEGDEFAAPVAGFLPPARAPDRSLELLLTLQLDDTLGRLLLLLRAPGSQLGDLLRGIWLTCHMLGETPGGSFRRGTPAAGGLAHALLYFSARHLSANDRDCLAAAMLDVARLLQPPAPGSPSLVSTSGSSDGNSNAATG
ncbi:hypothetical protein H696_03776 [Fonticula alba]|uniref:Integrator complex subunit 6-like beta-barrel domain-containing protein n=1 Tax=Fonticula alba TaxID=691883 RepID=A0A058Z4Y1_FONAL|nr:hypothetical protein H696_03776 [Fonticula alba]KCV69344.1 hypothetical protein H696_03776 [Fonticula alba]|eukprot:XP_009495909.1 hypothetical protein H696_03776 [Fonticula alba]